MAVSLPTAADVRKVREQAAKNAAERAEVARTPLFAVLGAGDAAVTAVTKAVIDARARSKAQAEEVQTRISTLPQKFTADEARKTVAELREQVEAVYAEFAERGEKAWGKLRTQPQVRDAIARIESYTEKLDARVDGLVDDAHDAAEKALAVVTRQTRSTGEKVARGTQKVAGEVAESLTEVSGEVAERVTEVSGEVAERVTEVSGEVAERITEVSGEVAERITEAGDEAAHAARSASRKVANRTAPKAAPKASPATTQPKPATRRTNGTSGS